MTRKTRDEYRLHVNCGHGQGWEHEVSEETFKEIVKRKREYAENASQYHTKVTGPHRVKIQTDA